MEQNNIITYRPAAETIKLAILQGQYEAAKGVNRIQLAVYFGIGKYISLNTRNGKWGTGALEAISQILHEELPGLRGYSASSMKNMRKFYENWLMLDPNSSVIADDYNSASVLAELESNKSTSAIVDLQNHEIDIYQSIRIPETKEFPVEDFFRVPFTQHIRIIEGVKDLDAQYYYIHRVAEENLTEKGIIQLIKANAYGQRHTMPSNFSQSIPDAALARKAVMMFKDSYLLDFINVEQIGERETIDVDEREVEQQIVQNIKQFIMTFGRDFTFVGNRCNLQNNYRHARRAAPDAARHRRTKETALNSL